MWYAYSCPLVSSTFHFIPTKLPIHPPTPIHPHSEHETIAREITKFLDLPSHLKQDESGTSNQNQKTKGSKKSRKQKGD